MAVNVHPMPLNYRDIPAKLRPMPAPVFPDRDPTEADVELARALFLELDQESKDWYGYDGVFEGLDTEPEKPRHRARRTRGAAS